MSYGIDIPIDALVTRFSSDLWTGFTNTFKGRIQRTVRDGGVFPEWYNPSNGRYEDVLLNKFVDSTVFFDVQSSEEYSGGQFTSNVWICFAINLNKLYPSVTERATEYAHFDALKVIRKTSFKPTGLVRGLDAFNEYKLVKESDNMNQFYLFRWNTVVKYPQNC